jgi:hypothetical protein
MNEKNDFKKLKQKSAGELYRIASFEFGEDRYSRYRDRILKAVRDTAYEAEMVECDAGGVSCGSVYCDKCRLSKQNKLFYRYRKHFETVLGGDETVARQRLRWVSVLHSVVAVDEKDEAGTINQVVSAAEEMKHQVSLIARNHKDSGLWLRGAIHLEIVDYAAFRKAVENGKGTVKEKTLTELIDRCSNGNSDYYFLVHFHALADKGTIADSTFDGLFKERWSITKRQVDIQNLWDEIRMKSSGATKKMKVDDSLRAFGRYCYSYGNDRLQYAVNWSHGRYITKSGEEITAAGLLHFAEMDDERQNSRRLSSGHIRMLVSASNAVNGNSHKGLAISIY